MRFLVALALLATVYGSSPDECVWGESYWCSSLTHARQCGAFQHCMDTVWTNTNIQKDDADVCQFCESIIKDVRDFVDDKKNQDEVKTFLTNACNIIPDEQLATQCKTSVLEQFDQLIQMIDSELDAAVVCSAMGLCSGFKDQVQHTPILKAGTDVCEFCESIIKDIRSFVDDKKNQAQVEALLDNTCEMIPDAELVTLCKAAVRDEITQIIQMIDSQMDPATVCQAMTMCSAASTMKQPVKAADEPLCPECTKFFMQVKSQMSDPGMEKQLQDLINTQLCSHAGQYEDMCKLAVETYLPQIMQMVASEVDPSVICSALGFCSSTPEARTLLAKLRLQQSPIFAAVPAGSAEECLLCKTVLGELQNLERDEAMQKEVENFLKTNLCGLLGSLQAVCETTVDQFAPELFELLVNELDPESRCTALGFCSAQSIESVLRSALPVVPKSAPPKVPSQTPKVAAAADPSTQCVMCEFLIKTLDSQLSDNATEEEIVDAVDKVCELLPDTIKAPCELFVQQYGATVIALLLQELDPQQVCTKMGLCSSEDLAIKAAVKASSQCILCEFVVTQLDQMLETNASQAEIITALDKVCSFLPSAVTADCTDFVNTYGPAVLDLLEQELEPATICAAIGLCQQQKKVQIKVGDAETCGICETVIQYVDSLVVENATIDEIEAVLDKVCNFLPDTIKQQCIDMVKEYGPALIEIISQELDPKEVCTSLGLCSSSEQAIKEAVKEEEHNSVMMKIVPAKIVPAKVALLGEKECTMGPAFWCLNMDNALKCDTVEHCKKHVWN